jgi:polyphosphate kinase 2 (PPK2 family)
MRPTDAGARVGKTGSGSGRQEKAHADVKAHQEKADAEAKARQERFLAILDGWKSYGKGTTTCQTEATLCSKEMEAMKMEATPGAVEWPELLKEEIDVDSIGSSKDRCEELRVVV